MHAPSALCGNKRTPSAFYRSPPLASVSFCACRSRVSRARSYFFILVSEERRKNIKFLVSWFREIIFVANCFVYENHPSLCIRNFFSTRAHCPAAGKRKRRGAGRIGE